MIFGLLLLNIDVIQAIIDYKKKYKSPKTVSTGFSDHLIHFYEKTAEWIKNYFKLNDNNISNKEIILHAKEIMDDAINFIENRRDCFDCLFKLSQTSEENTKKLEQNKKLLKDNMDLVKGKQSVDILKKLIEEFQDDVKKIDKNIFKYDEKYAKELERLKLNVKKDSSDIKDSNNNWKNEKNNMYNCMENLINSLKIKDAQLSDNPEQPEVDE